MLTQEQEQAASDRARCKIQLLAVHVAPMKGVIMIRKTYV